jgi:hypothetical protein
MMRINQPLTEMDWRTLDGTLAMSSSSTNETSTSTEQEVGFGFGQTAKSIKHIAVHH